MKTELKSFEHSRWRLSVTLSRCQHELSIGNVVPKLNQAQRHDEAWDNGGTPPCILIISTSRHWPLITGRKAPGARQCLDVHDVWRGEFNPEPSRSLVASLIRRLVLGKSLHTKQQCYIFSRSHFGSAATIVAVILHEWVVTLLTFC
jgi:hypothetical protein